MRDMIKSAIYGFAVADAVGVPFEFRNRDQFKCADMVGYGTWNQPKGTWSDDTSMVLATMDAFKPETEVTLDQIMRNFSKWYHDGKYTPHGNCFDIGGTTRQAIDKYDSGFGIDACGGTDEYSNGNGALMRILPFVFFEYDEDIIDRVAGITHNTSRSKFACEMYIKVAQSLIGGTFDPFDPYINMIREMQRENIKSTGYVLDTLIACLWSFLNSTSYKEAVLNAVNLGGDTDTIAALTGALAGIYYGFSNIPKSWVKNLANKKLIDNIIDQFRKSQVKSS